MYGIYVAKTGCIDYAAALAGGYKTIETRPKNMLRSLVGQRVAIIRTTSHTKPMVVGYADIVGAWFCPSADFDKYFNQHCVQPGSKYAPKGRGKWMYEIRNAERCDPYPLPEGKISHGRSYCEFNF